MKQLFDMFKVAKQASRVSTALLNYAPRRGARIGTKITWNQPPKYKHYDCIRSGDTAALVIKDRSEILSLYAKSKELEDADEKVKKIFSLGYQRDKEIFEHYKNQLVEKVRDHPLDNSSRAVKIATLTARIRHYQRQMKPDDFQNPKLLRVLLDRCINRRKLFLRLLKSEDYKKFEWLLEVLELKFQPGVRDDQKKLGRKKALLLIAKLNATKVKEAKIAALKKAFDEQKVPFLENKIAKLKEIKEKEEKFGLTPTVFDEDIQNCMERLEKVKLQVEENAKIGYLRKIHPYFLEPYHEKLLQEKEQAGQLLKEKSQENQQNKSALDTPS